MSMLTKAQTEVLRHLRGSYVGPAFGEGELIFTRPDLTYLTGVLFPQGSGDRMVAAGSVPVVASAEPDDISPSVADVSLSAEEASELSIAVPEEWRPSSTAISFVTDDDEILCTVSFGTYAPVAGPDGGWKRSEHTPEPFELSLANKSDTIRVGESELEIKSRWRRRGGHWLVTVSLQNDAETTGEDRADIPRMIFQVSLNVQTASGFHDYVRASSRRNDVEERDLAFRFRQRKSFAVGHGMSASWVTDNGRCNAVFLEALPWSVVPRIETAGVATEAAVRALDLGFLAKITDDTDLVISSLNSFCDEYSGWVAGLEGRIMQLDEVWKPPAETIFKSADLVERRMREGVGLLSSDEVARRSFSLSMRAMQIQMTGFSPNPGDKPPAWRPFQLGFILLSLASTFDPGHSDRDICDLIWFPTGGGKTEAYLGLAAFEVFRRRLMRPENGNGTAVITRYTLRLLTAQQFQRAAALICAMEMMRRSDPSLQQMHEFTIGLWVGNETTPGSWKDAVEAVGRIFETALPQEANVFQVEVCPWCKARLLPKERSSDPGQYGFEIIGSRVAVRCTREECPFANRLPLSVIDEELYESPPTILLSTVDKFARLQVVPNARRLLGIGTSNDQPSLIIQDEMHLLAGPLGTTVAAFEAALFTLLRSQGVSPKIVASTATIRSAVEQVESLYGRKVSLYPPSGFEDDQSFFSRPAADGAGRLYVGIMPQSVSQASAVIGSATPLLELPEVLADEVEDLDSYWTLVMYHNSLRELGRSDALVRDDIKARLQSRSESRGVEGRKITGDGLVELTSRRKAYELTRVLNELDVARNDESEPIDVVLSSNMLSVGIDITRLSLMLMLGQPKTTAEYIQATSRVGRGAVRGVIVTLFRPGRARDRSYFESFRGIHESLYRYVEPTSVTPWSLASRKRSLAGALILLLRNIIPNLQQNDAAGNFDLSDEDFALIVDGHIASFIELVIAADPSEATETRRHVDTLLEDWSRRAQVARDDGTPLYFEAPPISKKNPNPHILLKRFGIVGDQWAIGDSMRSVEPQVGIRYLDDH